MELTRPSHTTLRDVAYLRAALSRDRSAERQCGEVVGVKPWRLHALFCTTRFLKSPTPTRPDRSSPLYVENRFWHFGQHTYTFFDAAVNTDTHG